MQRLDQNHHAEGGAAIGAQPRRMTPPDLLLMAAFVVIAVVVGGIRATRNSFWVDEAATGHFVHRSFRGLLSLLWHEPGMGPYYSSLWFWKFVSDSDWWLRMFSVLGSGVAVALVYLLAFRLVGRVVAVVSSGALLANQAFQQHWSEARQYTWLVAMAAGSLLLYFRFRDNPTWRRAAASSVMNAVLLASSPFTAPLVALEWLWAHRLWRERNTRPMCALWAAASILLFLPFLHATATSPNTDWIPELTASRFRLGVANGVGGAWWVWALLIGNVLLLIDVASRGRSAGSLARVALLPVVGIAAPFAQAVISLVKPAFVPRYLMYALAPLLIGAVAGYEGLVRRAVSAERPKVVGLTFAAVALVVAGAITFPYSTMGKYLGGQDLRGAARILDSSTSATDRYLYVPDWLGSHVDYYFERPHGPGITEGAELDALPSGSRVWVTNSATEFESDLEQQLLARGVIGSKHELAGITVYEVVLTDN